MQLVKDKYYFWSNRIVTGLGVCVISIVGLALLMPSAYFLRENWGFGILTGTIALVQVIYGLFFFSREAKNNPWAAALVGQFILMLNIINLTHNTGQFDSWYIPLWALNAFVGGMFGVYLAVGNGFLITIYFVLAKTGNVGVSQIEVSSVAKLLAIYLGSVVGYIFWRRLYVDQESMQVKKLTGQLKTKEQQAELLIQSIMDGMIVADTSGEVTLINQAAASMTGWGIDEAIGINVNQIVRLSTEDNKELTQENNPFNKVLADQTPSTQTFKLVNRQGKNILISLAVSPVISVSKSITGMIAIMRNISAEKAEEQRRADFISTASHEMRTPVAAIEGYLALALNDKLSNIDTKARDYLEKAHLSTQHLGKLFQDLLTSARAEDGRLVSNPTVIEMGSFLEQITDSMRFSSEKSGLLMDFTIGSNTDKPSISGGKVIKPLYYIYADQDRLREVVTNLFDNAVKYTEAGKISVGLTGNSEIVQFYVRDTGSGIPNEDISHLFQKFYRVDSSSTRSIGGTGLGLFICRKIIELFNGRIWVESEPGRGSTFYVNIPRLNSQKASELQTVESNQLPEINNSSTNSV